MVNEKGFKLSFNPAMKNGKIPGMGVLNFDQFDKQNILGLAQFFNCFLRNFAVNIDDADDQSARGFPAEADAADIDFPLRQDRPHRARNAWSVVIVDEKHITVGSRLDINIVDFDDARFVIRRQGSP